MSTKIYADVVGLGNLSRFRLTGSERYDIREVAIYLIEDLQNVAGVFADKAFDANNLLEVTMKTPALIAPKANRLETAKSIKVEISLKGRLLVSNNFAALRRATTNSIEASRPSFPTPPV